MGGGDGGDEEEPRGRDGEHADRDRECNESGHDCLLVVACYGRRRCDRAVGRAIGRATIASAVPISRGWVLIRDVRPPATAVVSGITFGHASGRRGLAAAVARAAAVRLMYRLSRES